MSRKGICLLQGDISPADFLSDLFFLVANAVKLQRDVSFSGEIIFHINGLYAIQPNLKMIALGNDLEMVPLPLFEGALRRLASSGEWINPRPPSSYSVPDQARSVGSLSIW